jgi:hypothetical protein
MNNKYIETKFDTSFNTFKEAIAKTPYTINECWLNTIIDVYGDSLMSSNKRQVVNRDKILQIIGKTEDTVKDGISVNDILPFFKMYNLQLRVFDEFMRPLLKYDPDKPNHHHKVLYCLVKGDHVYTLNNNLKELQQKAEEDKMIIKASDSYFIKDDPVVPNYRMINDFVTVKNGRVINLGFEIDIFAEKSIPKGDIIAGVVSSVTSYFDINKWEMGDNIYVSQLIENINNVGGVLNVTDLRVYNKVNENGKYSLNEIAQPYIDDTTRQIDLLGKYTLFGQPNGMFEIKYPNKDIKVTISTS